MKIFSEHPVGPNDQDDVTSSVGRVGANVQVVIERCYEYDRRRVCLLWLTPQEALLLAGRLTDAAARTQ